ncbi:hypothetical protein HYH03_000981 [Edaphochlamys debaryana]|uniref:Uncharacterized protein n=1 Tax=Edaphochlamys debaryana TaxID=47281 RepID=A0A835YEN2_9CHLO|nr:hypothetical protein HYH03_000981 [Edaphochlamys debaryana]|eukprot:KAG2501166.1 hypothetical protein HYH03_000981 [Edaphochlamys debaryana]
MSRRGGMSYRSSARDATLQDVVWALSVDAADQLYRELKQQQCLAAARLTCSSLRRLIDGSVQELVVRERAPVRAPPSLARWPRCTAIVLAPSPERPEDEAEDEVFLHAPFVGQPESLRRRITSVRLKLQSPAAFRAGPAVCTLASYLPGLRQLDISGLSEHGIQSAASDAVLARLALSALRSLESLAVPFVEMLNGIEVLAGSLRRLSAGRWSAPNRGFLEPQAEGSALGPRVIESIAQLSRLEALCLCSLQGRPSGVPGTGLPALLNRLPPSLRLLELRHCSWEPLRHRFSLAATWEGGDGGGRAERMDLELSDSQLAHARSSFLEELVIPWAASQPPIRRLCLCWTLGRAPVEPLLQLLALGEEVEVQNLTLSRAFDLDAMPSSRELWRRARGVRLSVLRDWPLAARETDVLPLPRRPRPSDPTQQLPFQLPSPEEVWDMAVTIALAAIDAPRLPEEAPPQVDLWEPDPVLLLRRPAAAPSSVAAERGTLRQWLSQLFTQAGAADELDLLQMAALPADGGAVVSRGWDCEAVARIATEEGGAAREVRSPLVAWGLVTALQSLWAQAVAVGSVRPLRDAGGGSTAAAATGEDMVESLLRWALAVERHMAHLAGQD